MGYIDIAKQVMQSRGIQAPGVNSPLFGPGGREPTLQRPSELKLKLDEDPKQKVEEADLARYFLVALAAAPSARPVKDRRKLAEYLARSIVGRYGDPKQVTWYSGQPARPRKRDQSFWVAMCPAGHLTDEALETHQVLGWACEQCQRVYDARECRLVPGPRPRSGQQPAAPETQGGCSEGAEKAEEAGGEKKRPTAGGA